MSNRYPVEFSIGEQRFRVQRMSPLDGFRVWHEFTSHWARTDSERPEVAVPEEGKPEDWTDEYWRNIHQNEAVAGWINRRIMQLPADYLEELRAAMFDCMEAEIALDGETLRWEPLPDVTETVFGQMDAFAVTEAALRCFFCFFGNSFSGVKTLYYAILAEKGRLSSTRTGL